MKTNKKAQIDMLQPLIISLVVIALVLVVGFLIFAQVKTQVQSIEGGTTGYGYNATLEVTEAMEDIPGWLPIIVVVVIGALLIGLVSFLRNQAR